MGIRKQLSLELREDWTAFYEAGSPVYESYCRMGTPSRLFRVFSRTRDIKVGDSVLMEIDRGVFLAELILPLRPLETTKHEFEKVLGSRDIGVILRPASKEDLERQAEASVRSSKALELAKEGTLRLGLAMKVVKAECTLDHQKIVFHYTSNSRVDFRLLVRELSEALKARVEMRQIGVRDACKMIGGLGVCGREACCCSFLLTFNSVSVSRLESGLMQEHSTGPCGRLLCCLSFEEVGSMACSGSFDSKEKALGG